jgi:predicted ribosome quality control (RQC) complex YloA/Tae2 family protein
LEHRIRGARLRALRPEFDARRLALYFRDFTLLLRLHPREAGIFLLDPAEPPSDARRLAATGRSVTAPLDERILVLSFLRVRGSPGQVDLVTEWITNRHNAALTEGPERTVRMLFQTREGERVLRQGAPYRFPPAAPREGVEAPVPLERWREVLAEAPIGRDRRRALLSTFAWTSPINAPAFVEPPLEEGYRRWCEAVRIATGQAPTVPVLLELPSGLQPYPMPLAGIAHRPISDLLEGCSRASSATDETRATLLPATLVDRLQARVEAQRTRCARLEEELDRLDDADQVQALGDLLLARFGEVPRGARMVRLAGFDGTEVEVPLDPELAADANARVFYDEAARIRRARERLPELVARAREAWQDGERLLERCRTGEASPAEVKAALPEDRPGDPGDPSTLPFRRYRSSGGLEIRVGRGSRRNDELTFRHSSPDDIWLHARDVAGAHVILRWSRDGNPPARDLAEAATLAALGSKARTSGSVPVDWTRRKYVRKPRKAPPGLVTPDRVKTVFVEPDPELESRLRVDDG